MASPISGPGKHLSPDEIVKSIRVKIRKPLDAKVSKQVDALITQLSETGAKLPDDLKSKVSIWKGESGSSPGSSGGAAGADLALLARGGGGAAGASSASMNDAYMSAVRGSLGEIAPRGQSDIGRSLQTSLDIAEGRFGDALAGIDDLLASLEALGEQTETESNRHEVSAALGRCISAADALAAGTGVGHSLGFSTDPRLSQSAGRNTRSIESPEEVGILCERLNHQMLSESGSTIENLFILYVIRETLSITRQMVLLQSSTYTIKECLEQLEGFLRALDCPDRRSKMEILVEFFSFMISIKLKRDSKGQAGTSTPDSDDLVFRIGLQKCLSGDIDFFFRPAVESQGSEGSATAASVAKKKVSTLDRVDEDSFEQKFTLGCRAAQYLAHMTCTLGEDVAGFIYTKSKEHSVYADAFEEAMRSGQEKGKTIIKSPPEIEGNLSMKRRVKAMYQHRDSYVLSLTEPYRHLQELIGQYNAFLFGFHSASIQRIRRKLREIQAAGEDIVQQRSIQFSFMNENYEEILNNRKLILSYLEELIVALNEVKGSQELSAYLIMFSIDPEISIESRASQVIQGIKASLLRYKASHPNPNLERISAEFREPISSLFEDVEKINTTLTGLTRLHEELSRSNELIESIYLADCMCIGDLVQKGMVRMEGPMPIFSGPRASPPDVAVEELHPSEGVAEAAVQPSTRRLTGVMGPVSAADFSRTLQELLPVKAFPDAVGSSGQSARHAYLNALHYVESLYTLLTKPTVGTPDANSVAQLQMDIGFASFHALEQLASAMMILEKEKSQAEGPVGKKASAASAGASDLSLFNEVGHSLIGRLLAAKITPPKSVRSLLRDTEGMEFAIRDLSKPYKIPFLLQRTADLLSQRGLASSELLTEERKSREYGQSVLEVFASLLSTFSSRGRESRIDPEVLAPYLRATQDLIPEGVAAAGGSGLSDRAEAEAGKAAIAPKKATTPSPAGIVDIYRLDALTAAFRKALERTEDCPSAELRKSALEHNLNRFRHLVSCLDDPSNLPLLPFYASQARFVLCTILEEFLCAAYESKKGAVDQKSLAHSLLHLALPLGIKLADLSLEERNFLSKSARIRNEARYGYKPKAHVLPTFARASDLPAAESAVDIESASVASSEGWERVLGGANTEMIGKLREEFGAVVSLGSKVFGQSFGSVKRS